MLTEHQWLNQRARKFYRNEKITIFKLKWKQDLVILYEQKLYLILWNNNNKKTKLRKNGLLIYNIIQKLGVGLL